MKKDPNKTKFNPVLSTWTEKDFEKWFNKHFEGDWTKFYKGKRVKKDDN
jgi:hypothetical protein